MPLSKLQSEILRMLAAHRDPESYVAGSTYLTSRGPRYSGDIDIFHDREERVTAAADQDAATLQAAGLRVDWQLRGTTFLRALISNSEETTKLEWVVDSDFRFFPTVRDDVFGYVLHPVDRKRSSLPTLFGGSCESEDVNRVHEIGSHIWLTI